MYIYSPNVYVCLQGESVTSTPKKGNSENELVYLD